MNIENSGTPRSRRIGLGAIFLTWVTVAVVNSLAKILNASFSAEELLSVRSTLCIGVAFCIVGNKVWKVDWKVILSGFIIACSSVAYYRAIEIWRSVNSVTVVIAFMPIVNVVIALIEGKRISPTVIISMTCLMAGVVFALEPWNQPVSGLGLFWSIVCGVMGSIGFEMWGREPESVTVSQKCFWLSISALAVSLVIIRWFDDRPIDLTKYTDPRLAKTMIMFAIPVVVYIFASIIPFSRVGKMNVVTACILIQGATPATIIGSYFLVGETMNVWQVCGLFVALAGAICLSVQIIRAPKVIRTTSVISVT